jgi:hypothetical protein
VGAECTKTHRGWGVNLKFVGHNSFVIQCIATAGLQAHSGTVGGGWGNWLRESFGAGAFFLLVGKNIKHLTK